MTHLLGRSQDFGTEQPPAMRRGAAFRKAAQNRLSVRGPASNAQWRTFGVALPILIETGDRNSGSKRGSKHEGTESEREIVT